MDHRHPPPPPFISQQCSRFCQFCVIYPPLAFFFNSKLQISFGLSDTSYHVSSQWCRQCDWEGREREGRGKKGVSHLPSLQEEACAGRQPAPALRPRFLPDLKYPPDPSGLRGHLWPYSAGQLLSCMTCLQASLLCPVTAQVVAYKNQFFASTILSPHCRHRKRQISFFWRK